MREGYDIEAVNKGTDNLIDEINNLTAERDSLRKAYAVTNESWKELKGENEQLRQVSKLAKDFIDRFYPADIFTGISGDENVLMIVRLRKAIEALGVGE